MDAQKFWAIIDRAWQSQDALRDFRRTVLKTLQEANEDLDDAEETSIPKEKLFLGSLKAQLDELDKDDLLAFDRLLERKLYDLDRQDIHEYTDGSDDGFLYCRGFIVAMGKDYYEAISADPSKAMFDWECGAITYLSAQLYEEKFGALPPSEISRETQSNGQGWS